MAKLRNGKKIKTAVFNIGPIVLIMVFALAIFMIGRAIGRKECFAPVVINRYTRSMDRDYNDEMIRQRLLNLNSI